MLGLMGREGMRAGDGDRQQVVDRLKTALDEGRLDLHEYDERIQRAYAAKTYGDLDGLLGDLPGTAPRQRSQIEPQWAAEPVRPAEPGQQCGSAAKGGRSPVSGMFGVFLICTLVWAISSVASGGLVYFWPVWLLIPVAFGYLGRRGRRDKRADRD